MRQSDRESNIDGQEVYPSHSKEEVERPASKLLANELLTNDALEYSDAQLTLSPKLKDQKKPSALDAPGRVSKGGKSIIESDETFGEMKPKAK